MPEENEALKYPLPDSKKPLKVDGTAIKYVILVPKGYKEYPEKKIEQEEIDRLQDEISKLQEELKTLTGERDTMKQKLSEIKQKEKEETIQEVIELKKKLGIKEQEGLDELSLETLNAIKATLSEIPEKEEEKKEEEIKAKVPPSGEEKKEEQLSEEEKLRVELFGHKEPLEGI